MTNLNKPSRRTVITGITALMGGLALSDTALAALDTAYSNGDHLNRSFDRDQMKTIAVFMDAILPETETPSATGVGADKFFVHAYQIIFSAKQRKIIMEFLDHMKNDHTEFLSASHSDQIKLVKHVDDNMLNSGNTYQAYRLLKEFTLIGFYRSEVGATEELDYDPVPGPFHEVPLKPSSKATASVIFT